ncbi:MAG: adenylosuccinate synthetase [Flavobacteriales bacterium]|nr:adenylosuccinate synthetase [Flavobacteriales bacterium]
MIAYGQQPTHVPGPQNNSPIDLNNWFDIIVFIILPLGLIFLYFFWRRQVKKDKENN